MRFLLVSLCLVGLSYGAEQEKMSKMEQGTAPAVGQQLGTQQTQFQQQPFVTSGQVSTHFHLRLITSIISFKKILR